MIPIYRAKKIDSNEYVIGFYSSAYDIHHYVITHLGVDTKTSTVYQMSTDIHKIDVSTLSIHFPDMLDSQGNKIFASLREDGKGGDIVEKEIIGYAHNKHELFTVIMANGNTYARYSKNDKELLLNLITSQGRVNKCKLKVIGIQE